MRLQLRSEVFDPPIDNALLVTIFGYALRGRHRVEVDLGHEAAAAWLNIQAADLKDEIQLAIDDSAKREAREPSGTLVVLGRFATSRYDTSPIQLRINDAATFLETPVTLLLEDETSDSNFLLKMMTEEERAFIRTLLAAGFVRIEHGGGLSNMRTRIVARREAGPVRHTHWVFFDSDSMRPGAPSAQSEALRTACGDVPHHQLSRRNAESYIPSEALYVWASEAAGGPARAERVNRVAAFESLKREQRNHFNMKDGFQQDANRNDASAGDLYADVPADVRLRLAAGFGSNISGLFATDAVTEDSLRRDSGWSELRPVVQRLMSHLR